MFSLFEGGIRNTKCKTTIDLPELRRLIRNNPNAEKIARIRDLRKNGDKKYVRLKEELPYITPNCIVRERNLDGDNFERNFVQFSQYMYYDIDVRSNPYEYKSYFIDRYGHQATLISLSSSCGGLSVLFSEKYHYY